MADNQAITQSDPESANTLSYDAWLARQCGYLPDIFLGMVATRTSSSNEFHVVSAWPDPDSSMDTATGIIEEVLKEEKGLITVLEAPEGEDNNPDPAYIIAYPVKINTEIVAVVAQALTASSQQKLKQAMQHLEMGSGWVESIYRQDIHTNTQRTNQSISSSVDLLSRVLSEERFNGAAIRMVSELATMFSCDRVSLGFIKNKSIRINQLSHSAQFGKKMNLVRLIEKAMDEAVDQKTALYLPGEHEESILTAENKQLLETQELSSVMTIPLYKDYDVVGALTLEREEGKEFTQTDVEQCEAIASLSVGALLLKRDTDKNIIFKIIDSIKRQLSYAFGAEHYMYKTIASVLVVLLLFLSFYKTDYRLPAEVTLTSQIRQSIVAPYDGYIENAEFRAGDTVDENQVLVALDKKDLQLERLKWLSQQEKLNRHYQEALSKHERAKLNVLQAQKDQSEVQLSLVDMQLNRADIKSPISGRIINGDLSNRLGGAVTRGEELFEVAPLESYRIILLVKQNRISEVQEKQIGKVYFTALAGEEYAFKVTKITPVTVAKDGETYYQVEGTLDKPDEQLQLGMEGVAKVLIDERRLISVLTRDFSEWLKLQWWTLFG